jgi:hypothetical protein
MRVRKNISLPLSIRMHPMYPRPSPDTISLIPRNPRIYYTLTPRKLNKHIKLQQNKIYAKEDALVHQVFIRFAKTIIGAPLFFLLDRNPMSNFSNTELVAT